MSDGSAPVSVINWGQTQARCIPLENVPQPRQEEGERKKKERNLSPISPPAVPENEEHIVKLAQPKKPFPGGPARLNQKKKTVAFGRTVNVSQCIEGKPFAERKENTLLKTEKTMIRAEENKENAVPVATGGEKAQKKTQQPMVSDGGDVITKLQESIQLLVEKMEKMDKKVDAIETRQVVPVPANSTPISNFPSRQYDGYRQQSIAPRAILNDSERGILRDLEPMLQASNTFLQAVSDLCKRVQEPKIVNDRPSGSRDYRMPPATDRFTSPRRNSVMTERIVMQRSVQQPLSPTGVPFSNASFKYMMSNNIMPGNGGDVPAPSNYRRGNCSNYRLPSPSRYRPAPPVSNYRSVAHHRRPPGSYYEEDNIDLSDGQSVEDDFVSEAIEELPPSTEYRGADKSNHQRRHEARVERRQAARQ